VKNAKIQAFVSENPNNLAQYGLDRPVAQMSLVLGEENVRQGLLFGKKSEDERGTYAKHTAAPPVFLIPSDIVEALPHHVNDMRDTTLLAYNHDEVQKIELATGGDTALVLEREPSTVDDVEDSWKITRPRSYTAVTSEVFSWLWDLKDINIEHFVTDEPIALDLYGLDPPQTRVKIWMTGDDGPQELLLGNADAEHTGRYAKLGHQSTVVLVTSEALATLEKTPYDFRNRKILEIASDSIVKVRIAYPDTTLVFEKKGDTWKSQEPEKQELAGYKVNNLLYDVGALEFVEDVQIPDADVNTYGLGQPEVEMTFWEKGRKEGETIQVGTIVDGIEGRYLQRADVPVVYRIDSVFLEELPKTLTDLSE
jgi:hypothetical protein